MVTTRDITPDDLAEISDLGIRSKASWGYADQMMRVFREELTISKAEFESLCVARIALSGDHAVGYFTLKRLSPSRIELEHLFVDPDHFGQGVGSQLMAEALSKAGALGFDQLTLIADPNAEGFYAKHGAEVIGQHASSDIPGREIPIMRIDLCRA